MALTNYVLMPGVDYQAACDAIRAKTGKSELIKSGELASEISGITGGGSGGSVEGVHTVTFMSEDGSSVLYERLVVDGDDCADVVDRGLLATPTKESTAQYNYTHSGWSLTSGGSASASALKSVTADRTVYAAFESELRKYTITYYDEDGTTVLKTEGVSYGTTPSFVPIKEGASFIEWTPSLAPVTKDASYTAVWLNEVTFAGGSWADIAKICDEGKAADYFAIGDTRDVVFTHEDGTTESVKFEIVDVMPTASSVPSGVSLAVMATRTLEDPVTFFKTTPIFGLYYEFSTVFSYLKSLASRLPEDMQSAMKTVPLPEVCSDAGTSKLHLPSSQMIFGGTLYGTKDNNKKLASFKNGKSTVYRKSNGNSSYWYLANYMPNNKHIEMVSNTGTHTSTTNYMNTSQPIVPIFFI